jgi:hypothetical protein
MDGPRPLAEPMTADSLLARTAVLTAAARGWIRAEGQIAGHHARIFTPITEETP